MWALNVVYERDETRGFLRRRSTAWAMALFAFLGVALAFGLLVLGHHFATWIGRALDAQGTVSIVWWGAQWPFLVGGLLVAYAGILYLGPNVEHPRWRFLSLGAIVDHPRLAPRLRRVRLLREPVWLLQQDLGQLLGGCPALDLVLAQRRRPLVRCRDQRRSRTQPRAATGRTSGSRTAGPHEGVIGRLGLRHRSPARERVGLVGQRLRRRALQHLAGGREARAVTRTVPLCSASFQATMQRREALPRRPGNG